MLLSKDLISPLYREGVGIYFVEKIYFTTNLSIINSNEVMRISFKSSQMLTERLISQIFYLYLIILVFKYTSI